MMPFSERRRFGGALGAALSMLACTEIALLPPRSEGDRSMLVVVEGAQGAAAQGCDFEERCDGIAVEGDDWNVLTVLYPSILSELGIPRGSFVPLTAQDEGAVQFPESDRAFAANESEPELAPIRIQDSQLFHRYRMPATSCPEWTVRWSARAGGANRINAITTFDGDKIWAFADTGEILEMRPQSEGPVGIGAGPIVVAATRAAEGASVLTASGAIARVDGAGRVELVVGLPPLPQPVGTQDELVELAGDPDRSLVVQLVPNMPLALTATVWAFEGVGWSKAFNTVPRPRRQAVESLAEGPGGIYFSNAVADAPLMAFAARGPPTEVALGQSIDVVTQVRRYGESGLLAVSRRNEEVELHLGTLGAPGTVEWQAPVLLPTGESWRCSTSAQGRFLCSTPQAAVAVGESKVGCEAIKPPIPTDSRRIFPLGTGWLVMSYDHRLGVDSLHLVEPTADPI